MIDLRPGAGRSATPKCNEPRLRRRICPAGTMRFIPDRIDVQADATLRRPCTIQVIHGRGRARSGIPRNARPGNRRGERPPGRPVRGAARSPVEAQRRPRVLRRRLRRSRLGHLAAPALLPLPAQPLANGRIAGNGRCDEIRSFLNGPDLLDLLGADARLPALDAQRPRPAVPLCLSGPPGGHLQSLSHKAGVNPEVAADQRVQGALSGQAKRDKLHWTKQLQARPGFGTADASKWSFGTGDKTKAGLPNGTDCLTVYF